MYVSVHTYMTMHICLFWNDIVWMIMPVGKYRDVSSCYDNVCVRCMYVLCVCVHDTQRIHRNSRRQQHTRKLYTLTYSDKVCTSSRRVQIFLHNAHDILTHIYTYIPTNGTTCTNNTVFLPCIRVHRWWFPFSWPWAASCRFAQTWRFWRHCQS